MAFDGNGNYTLPTPQYPAIPGDTILAESFNTIVEDIQAALSETLTRDGQAPMTGDLDMGGHTIENAVLGDGATATTRPVGENSTKLATMAALLQAAFQAALPVQISDGNNYVPKSLNGVTAWSQLKTIGGSSIWGTGDIITGISTVGATVTDNYTIAGTAPTIWPCATTAIGKSITAPAANGAGMVKGLFAVIDNKAGGYPVGFRDSTGVLIMAVAAGGVAHVYLEDTSTAAGTWRLVGTNLEPGLITIDSTFSSTYASTVLAPFVALDSNTSIHFAALSSGFAAFVVDNTGKTVGTPVTVDATGSSVPREVFRVSATSAILFYGVTYITHAVVLTVSGTSISVGSASALTAPPTVTAGGAPTVCSLTSSLYLVASTNAGGTTFYSQAFSVSGAAISTTAAASTAVANIVPNSTTVYALTATTALALYKSGAGAPYANNAVVVSVSGTTCTVGTPAALTNCSGVGTTPPSSVLLSSTKCLVADDNNATSAIVIPVTISGTTVTAGTALTVEAAIGNQKTLYTTDSATRYNPHLFALSASSALFWYMNSGVSSAVVLSENGGTITKGTIVYKSISAGTAGSAFSGQILPQGASEFVALRQQLASSAGCALQLSTGKINGTTLTSGTGLALRDVYQDNPNSFCYGKLSSGDYILIAGGSNQIGQTCIPVFKSNGDSINARGSIGMPEMYLGGYGLIPNVSSSRFVVIGAGAAGTTVGTSTYQLRLLSVEIAQ